MSRGKQYVKKVFGILGEKRQRGGATPFGLLTSIAARVWARLQNQYLVKFLVGVVDEKETSED